MNAKKITEGYQEEVTYQKRMLQNLQYWLQFFLAVGAIGFVLCYYFYRRIIWLFIIGIILLLISMFSSAIIAYGKYRGKKNLKLLISDYQKKINYLEK